jgi:hypothetical protein
LSNIKKIIGHATNETLHDVLMFLSRYNIVQSSVCDLTPIRHSPPTPDAILAAVSLPMCLLFSDLYYTSYSVFVSTMRHVNFLSKIVLFCSFFSYLPVSIV